jgi:tetraprenyl-beta-curcumene synthase
LKVPSHPITLMSKVYREVFPSVHRELKYWNQQANVIPNVELRHQALASIQEKQFHCEGGGIFALLSGEHRDEAIRFIVAYQTISDYLDNLCDRSTSLDPKDFEALHDSMMTALTIGKPHQPYYRFRTDQNDGGYLENLVEMCQQSLEKMTHYDEIQPYLLKLCQYYSDLQIHKHVIKEERVDRLINWHELHRKDLPSMEWYEFSACSGSTLGIFCLVSYAFRKDFLPEHATMIFQGYFPYIQGLHILLDYFIDQEEDQLEGDLNFCSYYQSPEDLFIRIQHFLEEADTHTQNLPNENFHRMINRGLLGVYLSDEKVNRQKEVRKLARKVMKFGGKISLFFYMNGRAYRGIQRNWSRVKAKRESNV